MPAVRALDATSKRRELRGLDRRAVGAHLRRHVIPRPPLPIPYLKMLYRHPRCGMGCDQDKAALEGGDKFFSALKLRENFKKAASRSPGPAAVNRPRQRLVCRALSNCRGVMDPGSRC